MDWKQNGEVHCCGDYTIVEHNQNEKHWYSLEYGERYVREGSYATLSDAKRAASEHADRGSPLNELSEDHDTSSKAATGYYECFTCHTVEGLPTDVMPGHKCMACGTTNGRVISQERYDEGWKAGVYSDLPKRKR